MALQRAGAWAGGEDQEFERAAIALGPVQVGGAVRFPRRVSRAVVRPAQRTGEGRRADRLEPPELP